jgi:hypothetical protein
MKPRLLFLTLTILTILPLTAAQTVQTQYYSNTTAVQPGQSTHLGNFQVQTGNNTTVANLTASTDLPFNTTVTPVNATTLEPNQSVNYSITVSPPPSFPAGTVSGTLNGDAANYSLSQELTANITTYENWTTPVQNVTRNLSVGSQGTFTELPVHQLGNRPQRSISTNLTGNISTFLSVPDQLTVFRQNPQNLTVSYNILNDQRFGQYNGTLTLTGGNQTHTVSLDTRLVDEINPEIDLTDVNDIPATKPGNFKVKTSDNLAVANVTGTVYRRHTVNGTVERQEFTTFEFGDEGNGVYEYEFENTEIIGDYELVITAVDTSGNTVNTSERFDITWLNGVHLLDSNFGVGHVIHGETAAHKFLKINQSTPVEVTLHSITPGKASSKVDIGLQKHGETAARYFQHTGDTQEIDDVGEYDVVVRAGNSNVTPIDITGQLRFDTVDQQPTPDPVFFTARLISGYGRPVNFSVDGMTGYTFYDNFENGVPQTKGLYIEGPAAGCQNTSVMTEDGCVPNANFGLVQNKTETIDSLRSTNGLLKFLLFAETSIFLVVFVVLRTARKYRGVLKTQGRIDLKAAMGHYGDDEDSDEDSETGGAT